MRTIPWQICNEIGHRVAVLSLVYLRNLSRDWFVKANDTHWWKPPTSTSRTQNWWVAVLRRDLFSSKQLGGKLAGDYRTEWDDESSDAALCKWARSLLRTMYTSSIGDHLTQSTQFWCRDFFKVITALLKKGSVFFSYTGGLTASPCTVGVHTWLYPNLCTFYDSILNDLCVARKTSFCVRTWTRSSVG